MHRIFKYSNAFIIVIYYMQALKFGDLSSTQYDTTFLL